MFGYTDTSGAANAPASVASAHPAANTPACSSRGSSPSNSTISGFSAAARIADPTRVSSITRNIAPATSTHTPSTARR